MLAFAVGVLLETHVALLGSSLATAAQASPRPHECQGASDGSDGLWLRLRGAEAERFCDWLARGHARLEESASEALKAANAAEALAGSTAAVRVLRGRAQLRLGEAALAYEEFALAEAADGHAFADPRALHDYARAASRARQSSDAVRLYRLLTSRLALLDDPRERTYCQIEAAAHVLALTPGGAEEALGYLAQARKQALGMSAWLVGLRVLAQQQGGQVGAVASDLSAARRESLVAALAAAAPGEDPPLLPAGQLDLLRAALSAPSPTRSRAR